MVNRLSLLAVCALAVVASASPMRRECGAMPDSGVASFVSSTDASGVGSGAGGPPPVLLGSSGAPSGGNDSGNGNGGGNGGGSGNGNSDGSSGGNGGGNGGGDGNGNGGGNGGGDGGSNGGGDGGGNGGGNSNGNGNGDGSGNGLSNNGDSGLGNGGGVDSDDGVPGFNPQTFLANGSGQCPNVMQCCQSFEKSSDSTSLLSKLLRRDLVGDLVGHGCTSDIDNCASNGGQTACCGSTAEGAVALDCSPITLNAL